MNTIPYRLPPEDPGRGFHAGERLLQASIGVAEELAPIGQRVIRDHMPEQHQAFFAQQPFIVLGAADATGQPWATVLAGPPGFVHAPTPQRLRVAALPQAGDPLQGAIRPGLRIGLLGIQPATRRRNRLNGVVTAVDDGGFELAVLESFGNCPKYIQGREVAYLGAGLADVQAEVPAGAATGPAWLDAPDAAARQLIAAADTLFIASRHPGEDAALAYGADASHRGGAPGFVRLSFAADGTAALLLPDYAGNRFFNTFGNLLLEPRVGLVFVSPGAPAGLLHVAGRAEILSVEGEPVLPAAVHSSAPAASAGSAPMPLNAFPGAERLLRIVITAVRHRPRALSLDWPAASLPSPFLPAV